MILTKDGQTLPYGQDVTFEVDGEEYVISYASLLASEEAREQAGVETAEAPPSPPVRRLIRKSVVQERVHAIGKMGAAFTALQSDPISFGRWFAPDWPNVYFDDEGLLAMLEAIGCTEAQIAAITAA
jgi:hypothetical protein